MNALTRVAQLIGDLRSGHVLQQLGHPAQWIPEFAPYSTVASGASVTQQTALEWTAVSAGLRLVSETLASLPLDLLERMEPRGRKPRPDHPAAQVFKWPNPEMTGFELVELLQNHAMWWGNGYAQIVFDGARRPIELWPLSPDRVSVERDSRGTLVYRVSLPYEPFGRADQSTVLPADEVLHIRGFSKYGLMGERLSHTFREAIGLGLASEVFGALLFGQGLNPSGVLEHPGTLSTEAQDRLREQKAKQVGGLSRAHKLMVLEEGMKWHQTTIEPEKAQFLGLRKFQVTEAARMLRIPPHKLYDLERATFSNIEHQDIEFVRYTMMPWAVRWEQRLAKHLLGRKDFSRLYFRFNMYALLRGDTAAQTAAFTAGRNGGWLSPNDIRELMDLNPREGGDVYADVPTGGPNPVTPTKPEEPTDDDDDAQDD